MAMRLGGSTLLPKKYPKRGYSPFGKHSPLLLEWEAQDQHGCLLRRTEVGTVSSDSFMKRATGGPSPMVIKGQGGHLTFYMV